MLQGTFENYHGAWIANFYTPMLAMPEVGSIQSVKRTDGRIVQVKLLSKIGTVKYGDMRLTRWTIQTLATL